MKKSFVSAFALSVLIVGAFTSCSSYRANIMFKVPEGYALDQAKIEAESNYIIQRNDYLKLDVYTNAGERIIDPDLELTKDITTQTSDQKEEPQYLVDTKGLVKLPMVGEIHLEGLTIRDAEAILQKEYTKFYTNPFVRLRYINKRVIVLGAPGGLVIPLADENMRLVEVIAMAKGVDNNARAHNIRVLRNDHVFLCDLSTIESYKTSNIIMQPGDVVYIEPIRRPFSEGLRDYAGILTVVTSLTTLIVVLSTF